MLPGQARHLVDKLPVLAVQADLVKQEADAARRPERRQEIVVEALGREVGLKGVCLGRPFTRPLSVTVAAPEPW